MAATTATTAANRTGHLVGHSAHKCKQKQKEYKGVFFMKWRSGKKPRLTKPWSARISPGGRVQKRLGYYDTPEEAARAYDRAARKMLPSGAYLNFPDKEN
jgi:hypothetical protein